MNAHNFFLLKSYSHVITKPAITFSRQFLLKMWTKNTVFEMLISKEQVWSIFMSDVTLGWRQKFLSSTKRFYNALQCSFGNLCPVNGKVPKWKGIEGISIISM